MRTAGCIHRRRRSAHALLTLRAHISASSWHFYSKHQIACLFIFSSLSTVPPPPHFLPPSSLSRVPLSLLHWRHLLTKGLHPWEARRNEVRGGAATLRAQGKGGWERRRNGVRGRGSAPHAARPGRARHRQGRRPPPSRRTLARGPLAAHACGGSVQHRRGPARCRGRVSGRGRAMGEGGAARPRMAGRAGRGGEGWQSVVRRDGERGQKRWGREGRKTNWIFDFLCPIFTASDPPLRVQRF